VCKVSMLIRCYEYNKYTENTISSIIKTARSDYDIIIHPRKASAAVNSNMLLDYARADKVILMDDDLEFVEDGWDLNLLDTHELCGYVGCVAPQLTDQDGNNIGPKPMREPGSISIGGEVWGAILLFSPTPLIRYDENYIKTTCDDTDFLYQWLENGFIHMTDTTVHVKHTRELSAQKAGGNKQAWYHQNYAYLTNKWMVDGKFPSFGDINYWE